jgi:hypothetical protein
MKKLFLTICPVLFACLCFAQAIQKSVGSNLSFITLDSKQISYWYGPKPGLGPGSHHPIIQGEYGDKKHGWARIMFYPKKATQFATLDSAYKTTFKKSQAVQDGWARTYILTDDNASNFDIWAVFVDEVIAR